MSYQDQSHDFQVKWQGSEEATARKILVNLIVERLKAGMPVVIVVVGKSSSGKSAFALLLQDLIYQELGIDFVQMIDKCVLIKPDDWITKTEQIFFSKDKSWKDVQSLQMDEAKFLINSDDWQTQKNRAINGIIATSRTIKPLVFIVVCQLLKDVQSKTRETLDFIFEVKRSPKKKPIVIPTILYEKRFDINKISIKPRRLRGLIEYEDGRFDWVTQLKIRPPMPRAEVWDKYKSFEVPDKTIEIKKLFDNLRDSQDKLSGESEKKLQRFTDWLIKNPNEIEKYGKWNKKTGEWSFDVTQTGRLNYNRKEIKTIETMVRNNLSVAGEGSDLNDADTIQ